jgi:hypothetical protein
MILIPNRLWGKRSGTTTAWIVWNSLKGSWNLGLQTLGWGNYLLRDDNPLYQAMWHNSYLRRAYKTLTCPPECELYLPYISKPAWHFGREAEFPDDGAAHDNDHKMK